MPGTMHSPVAAVRRFDPGSARKWLREYGPEAVGFIGVIVVAIVVRLINLGTIPRIVTGDETSTLQDAVRINAGIGPGLIDFDWAQSPSLHIYPLAWIVRIFGDSVADIRLYCVIFSLLAIILLYFLARETMGAIPALAATLLLATNVWFLNFSRTLWYNMNSPFFAVGACWSVTRALKTEGRQRWLWWLATALFVTGGLYGYSTGRFIWISVGVTVTFAVATRLVHWRRALPGLVLVAVVSGILFAPMAGFIYNHFDTFTNRADTVSVFHVKDADGTTKNGWLLAWKNLEPNYRGLIFNDGLEGQRGSYNARYHPLGRAGLEIIGANLFLAGLIIAVIRWKQTYTWFPFVIPAVIANVFSGDTPDLGRLLIWAPFYFLFIGLVFDEVLRRRWRFAPTPALLFGITAITAFISVRDVKQYFDWQAQTATQSQRMPGIDYCEWPAWIARMNQIADEGARSGSPRLFLQEEFAPVRLQLKCSPVVREMGGYDPNERP